MEPVSSIEINSVRNAGTTGSAQLINSFEGKCHWEIIF